jgi:hypothetical protein
LSDFFSLLPDFFSDPPSPPPCLLLAPPFIRLCWTAIAGTTAAADAGVARNAAPIHSTTVAPATPNTHRMTHRRRSTAESRSRTAPAHTGRPAASPSYAEYRDMSYDSKGLG